MNARKIRAAMMKQLAIVKRERKALIAHRRMVISKATAISNLVWCAVTDLEIHMEIVESQDAFVNGALNPLKAALMTDRLCASSITQSEHLVTVGKEYELKCSNLKRRIEQAKEQLDAKRPQLDDEVPDVDELKRLSNNDLKEIIDKWQNLKKFVISFEPVYRGFKNEWDVIKAAYQAKIKESVSQVVILDGDGAAIGVEYNDD